MESRSAKTNKTTSQSARRRPLIVQRPNQEAYEQQADAEPEVRRPAAVSRPKASPKIRLNKLAQPLRLDKERIDKIRLKADELRPAAANAFVFFKMMTGLAPKPGVEKTPLLESMRREVRMGASLCFLIVFGIGGWAAMAQLSGAIIAPATVVVENDIKKVQHPTGGVVGEIRVKDGDLVKSGDVVLKLDETTTQASLSIITKQLDEFTGRRARLESERDGAENIVFPEDFLARAERDPGVKKIVAGERAFFQARRSTQAGQKAQLQERIARLKQRIEGLEEQKAAKQQQSALTGDESKAVQELYSKNLTVLSRFMDVQRNGAQIRGELGQIIATTAEAKGTVAETELQIIQVDQDMRSEVLKELRDIEGKMNELAERKISGEDQLRRIDVRSPHAGFVHQLAVHTVGGVIAAGETLMIIVPRADALAIDAKVAPEDIDQIVLDQPGIVRLSAFSQQMTPEFKAKVVRIAADVTRDDKSGASPHYAVRVAIEPSELNRLKTLKLIPGMPAEVHIKTNERTALSYFLKPLSDQFTRAFREE